MANCIVDTKKLEGSLKLGIKDKIFSSEGSLPVTDLDIVSYNNGDINFKYTDKNYERATKLVGTVIEKIESYLKDKGFSSQVISEFYTVNSQPDSKEFSIKILIPKSIQVSYEVSNKANREKISVKQAFEDYNNEIIGRERDKAIKNLGNEEVTNAEPELPPKSNSQNTEEFTKSILLQKDGVTPTENSKSLKGVLEKGNIKFDIENLEEGNGYDIASFNPVTNTLSLSEKAINNHENPNLAKIYSVISGIIQSNTKEFNTESMKLPFQQMAKNREKIQDSSYLENMETFLVGVTSNRSFMQDFKDISEELKSENSKIDMRDIMNSVIAEVVKAQNKPSFKELYSKVTDSVAKNFKVNDRANLTTKENLNPESTVKLKCN